MKRTARIVAVIILIISSVPSNAQKPQTVDAAEILKKLEKLQVLANVLYVAAHPDDENTRLIAYFSKHELANTGYFAFTRGDGGQNLLGPEIREKLGVIRTQELLAARRIDGGRQFFSRAVDFGYSKNPDETFKVWDREKVLGDLVWVIRNFKPDIIITRFNTLPGTTHGHHTASAILAREAFKLAGDPGSYPEQLAYTEVWQPRRIFWNTSWWFYGRRDFDSSGMVKINVGTYDPVLGLSYSELAAESRSMHKSQGFGASGQRGDDMEYLTQWEGDHATGSTFDDMDISLSRVTGGATIKVMIDDIIDKYDEADPERIIPDLLNLRQAVSQINDKFWKMKKLNEIDELIYDCTGMFLEVRASDFSATPGSDLKINVEAINRSDGHIELEKFIVNGSRQDTTLNYVLKNNKDLEFETNMHIPEGLPVSQPYWLRNKPEKGMFVVKDQKLIGKPENDPAMSARFTLNIDGTEITYQKPVIYKENDPVKGEVYRPFIIIDPVQVNLDNDVYIFPDNAPRTVNLTVRAGEDHILGTLSLNLDPHWKVTPESIEVGLDDKNEEKVYSFQVTPPAEAREDTLKATVMYRGKEYSRGFETIDYSHIPEQTLFPVAETKMVKLNIQKKGHLVGYIEGAGDDIPQCLEQIGYKVEFLHDDDFANGTLNNYDAIVVGVRAYNTVAKMKFYQPKLMEYVKNGGTLIVQYNNSYRMVTENIGPYPLELSHDRVTVEEAPVTILAKDNPVMNTPNKIGQNDFKGWVQERGLYFADKWDSRYTPVLSCHDPGEEARNGGFLVTQYGKGYYIYTGYSWFRELPAGVSGAYRIFANMISLGN